MDVTKINLNKLKLHRQHCTGVVRVKGVVTCCPICIAAMARGVE